ncbi:UNVERIFIED_CONTAM: hypothetical protein GTU68_060391 [Idotea baltica]|nr:hypothetical protein [Idotea baltica]
MKWIVKVFSEITIKSRPVRKQFIRQLSKNIRSVLRDLDPNIEVLGVWDNLTVFTREENPKILDLIVERLCCTPGIASVLFVNEYPLLDFDNIVEKCKIHFGPQLLNETFSVRCKRAGKHLFSSMDVERYVGSKLRQQCGAAGISLRSPKVEVRIEIRDKQLFVIHNKFTGIGGYPLGTLEQSLVLMSGGFDSTVAAYNMMRRGIVSHFCFFNLGGRAHELGVMEVAHYLWQKFGRSQRVLFIRVPFEEVVSELLEHVDNRYMGVILKRLMVRAASKIADDLSIDSLVTGEAISQVSSQTLSNLTVIDRATEKLIFRPLATSHKQDIIDTAVHIGTADFAKHMPEYCGVISVNPTTRAKLGRVEHEEAQFNQKVFDRAIENTTRMPINKVMDEQANILEVEEVHDILRGHVVIDIRHPDEVDTRPVEWHDKEVRNIPFYALNSTFKTLDANRQYLLYCDKGVMSRLHAYNLLSEGYVNVRVFRPI